MKRILLADDDANICSMYQLVINNCGLDVECDIAHNMMAVLELLTDANKEYDAMILDYHLADTNGVELMNTIKKAIYTGRALPIAILTADATAKTNSIASNAEAFIVKGSLDNTAKEIVTFLTNAFK